MISSSSATRVFLAPGATDLRKGFDGLEGLVRQQLQEDPLSGHLFLFCNKLRTRLKVFYWDGSGLWVCCKRLEKGRFSWPELSGNGKMQLTHEELMLLLGGIELEKTRRKEWWRQGAQAA